MTIRGKLARQAMEASRDWCDRCGADLLNGPHLPGCGVAGDASVDIRKPSWMNKSGFIPEGQAVLLLPYDPEVKSSVIVVPDNVKRQLDMVEIRGTVIDIGPDAWNTVEGHKGTPRARIGDNVMVSKWCGALIRGPLDDVQYRVVNGRDIYGRIFAEADSSRVMDATRQDYQRLSEESENG